MQSNFIIQRKFVPDCRTLFGSLTLLWLRCQPLCASLPQTNHGSTNDCAAHGCKRQQRVQNKERTLCKFTCMDEKTEWKKGGKRAVHWLCGDQSSLKDAIFVPHHLLQSSLSSFFCLVLFLALLSNLTLVLSFGLLFFFTRTNPPSLRSCSRRSVQLLTPRITLEGRRWLRPLDMVATTRWNICWTTERALEFKPTRLVRLACTRQLSIDIATWLSCCSHMEQTQTWRTSTGSTVSN